MRRVRSCFRAAKSAAIGPPLSSGLVDDGEAALALHHRVKAPGSWMLKTMIGSLFSAQRDRRSVHHREVPRQHVEIGQAGIAFRLGVLVRVGGIDAVHLVTLSSESQPISAARSAAACVVVKKGLPVPAAKITTRPFSMCRTGAAADEGFADRGHRDGRLNPRRTPIFSSADCMASAFITGGEMPIESAWERSMPAAAPATPRKMFPPPMTRRLRCRARSRRGCPGRYAADAVSSRSRGCPSGLPGHLEQDALIGRLLAHARGRASWLSRERARHHNGRARKATIRRAMPRAGKWAGSALAGGGRDLGGEIRACFSMPSRAGSGRSRQVGPGLLNHFLHAALAVMTQT